jgi:hypothetical protein
LIQFFDGLFDFQRHGGPPLFFFIIGQGRSSRSRLGKGKFSVLGNGSEEKQEHADCRAG